MSQKRGKQSRSWSVPGEWHVPKAWKAISIMECPRRMVCLKSVESNLDHEAWKAISIMKCPKRMVCPKSVESNLIEIGHVTTAFAGHVLSHSTGTLKCPKRMACPKSVESNLNHKVSQENGMSQKRGKQSRS